MKKHPALAILEFKDICVGIHATDAMLKKAPISLLKSGIISEGRYLALLGGTTASVDESYNEGLFWGGDSVIDHVFLPDVHEQLHDAILAKPVVSRTGSLAVIETPTISCNVRAAELALKGTPVQLVQLRVADSALGGKGISLYRGELHDIVAAVELAVSSLKEENRRVQHKIIPAPHEALASQGEASAFFLDTGILQLDGEVV